MSANLLNVTGATVVKKRNTKSCVWNEFGIRVDDKGKVIESEKHSPLCLTCGKSVQAKGSNTTNLWQHLQEHHPSTYARISSQKIPKKGECSSNSQPTLEVTIARKAKYHPAKSCQAKEINKAVTYFIAKDAIPVSTVSKPGFKHLVSKLNPKYEIPTRKHFSEIEILALYSLVRAKTVKPLVSKAECYAATTDLWTSGSCDPYITVTLHFIDYEWNLKSFCLDTVPMYDDHTGQNISDALLDVY